jgi:hypothetical protein
MRHTRLTLYAILGALLIIAAWVHSFWKGTSFEGRWGPPTALHEFGLATGLGEIQIWAGESDSSYIIDYGLLHWNGVKFQQLPVHKHRTLSNFGAIWIDHQNEIPSLVIKYWFILLLYTAFWLTLLTRLSRRRKSHPTPPSPPVIEK